MIAMIALKLVFVLATLGPALPKVNPNCKCVVFMGGEDLKVGQFYSPNYDRRVPYPNDIGCILYTFVADSNEIVNITFNALALKEKDEFGRCRDYLKLYLTLDQPDINEETFPDKVLCGNLSEIGRQSFYSTGRALVIEFHSEVADNTLSGFLGEFRFIRPGDFITNGHLIVPSNCSYEISNVFAQRGNVYSPNYPLDYSPSIECFYYFTAQFGQSSTIELELMFHYVHLKSFSPLMSVFSQYECTSMGDFVEIYRGVTINEQQMVERLCDNLPQSRRYSVRLNVDDGQSAMVRFKTDSVRQNQGFHFEYRFLTNELSLFAGDEETDEPAVTEESTSISSTTLVTSTSSEPAWPTQPRTALQWTAQRWTSSELPPAATALQSSTQRSGRPMRTASTAPPTRPTTATSSPFAPPAVPTAPLAPLTPRPSSAWTPFFATSSSSALFTAASATSTVSGATSFTVSPLTDTYTVNALSVSSILPPTTTFDCYRMFSSGSNMSGKFQQPSGQRNIVGRITCFYEFRAGKHQHIRLGMHRFSLYYPRLNPHQPPDCDDVDRLILYDGVIDRANYSYGSLIQRGQQNRNVIWELCGKADGTRAFMSSGSHLTLVFEAKNYLPSVHGDSTFDGWYTFFNGYGLENIKVSGSQIYQDECKFRISSLDAALTGSLTSPNYPNFFPKTVECHYLLDGQLNELIKLDFKDFKLSVSPPSSCQNVSNEAYLEIVEHTQFGEQRVRLCGNSSGIGHYVSEGPNVLLIFRSHYSIPSLGFNVQYSFKQFTDETSVLNGDEAVTELIDSSNGTTKTVVSPGYGGSYPEKVFRRYVIKSRLPSERIQIRFHEFNLFYVGANPDNPQSCRQSDRLLIYNNQVKQSNMIKVSCGHSRPQPLMSEGDEMIIEFRALSRAPKPFTRTWSPQPFAAANTEPPSAATPLTNNLTRFFSAAKDGPYLFKFEVRFITNYGITSGAQEEKTCTFRFSSTQSSNGSFCSPNFPGIYPRNTECHYLFYGLPGEQVVIQILYFNVEGMPPQCLDVDKSDYLQIGPINGQSRERYCGRKRPPGSYYSQTNELRVTFQSNGVYERDGFNAYYLFGQFPSQSLETALTSAAACLTAGSPFAAFTRLLPLTKLHLALLLLSFVLMQSPLWHSLARIRL